MRFFTPRAGVLTLTLIVAAIAAKAQQPSPPAGPAGGSAVEYDRDVRPILERHCYECHGASKSRGKLRLHKPAFIGRGGSSGPVVVPSRSEESLIIRRVLGLDDEDRMPLDADPLAEAEIAALRAWIAQGASFGAGSAPAGGPTPADGPTSNGSPGASAPGSAQEPDIVEHWAYVKPKRPALPAVSNESWVRNPIDRFVLARLDREKLAPGGEASRATLLRRVSLDLIGLPPSPDEADAFVADRSPDAYEKVVDRLLTSPHYGERWARPWLDLARFADTNGHEKDNRRSIWKYRDWVIDAFNRDLPFDQFTIEQIAGDMLPDATIEQRIATGFHRNAMTNEEGGVDPEESMYEVLVDRVNTTATVWLGSTLACAQCHNHKYDPFSQRDYFRFLAFFAGADYQTTSSTDATRYHEAKLDLASAEQEAQRSQAQARVDRLQAELKQSTPELVGAQAAWERTLRDASRAWTPLVPAEATATGGVVLTRQSDASIVASGPNAKLTTYTVRARTTATNLTGLRLEALPDPSLPRGGPGRDTYGHFRLTGIQVDVTPASDPRVARRLVLAGVKVDDSAYGFDGRELGGVVQGGYAGKRAAWAINAMRDTERLPRQAVMRADAPFGFPGGSIITVRLDHRDGTIGQGLGRFRLSVTEAADPLAGADLPARLRPIVAMDAGARTEAQAEELATELRATSPLLAVKRAELAAAREALTGLQIPSTLVMKERASFERPSYELRERGSFTARGPRMFACAPSALHRMRDELPANRLGLARWLVDRENPLVARVAVNRLWEQIFGRGLVETSEDFGAQGDAPSHPELLDWLASEFVGQGWSQKAILKTIVMSATYRQSSGTSASLVERDPYNRLLARGPRFRMEAEMIRDVALTASGLLSRKLRGPSVFPLQPDGIWDIPYNKDKWVTSEGEDRYRRSLYTFLRRTSPYPSFMTFDATSRELCTVRRVRTNTPLQALTLLNDRAAFEAARALAGRMRRDPAAGATTGSRASYGFRLCVSRAPSAEEVARLVTLFEEERRHYVSKPLAAGGIVGSGDGMDVSPEGAADAAAWAMVANVLLNLDETMTKN